MELCEQVRPNVRVGRSSFVPLAGLAVQSQLGFPALKRWAIFLRIAILARRFTMDDFRIL
ncbi:MAG: hypothetical protein QOI22_1731 [Verrucomicrobiota bacterium]